jgi:hypothetical protein
MKSISAEVRGRRWSLFGLVLGAAVLTAGCGTGGNTVSGTIKYNDQAVPSGTVVLTSADGKVAQGGITDGKYVVQNAPSGACKIGVLVPKASGAAPEGGAAISGLPQGSAMPGGKDVPGQKGMDIPDKFASPDTSGLSVTVSGNTTHNIDMK